MNHRHAHAIRALALVEAAVKLLQDAQVEIVVASGGPCSEVRSAADATQAVEGLQPELESLITRTAAEPAVQRTRTKERR